MKKVTFEEDEYGSEDDDYDDYDSEDEFYDDDEYDDEGAGYQLASDYDIEYDDDDDEGGALYGGVRRRRRSAYNRFVAKWAKKKKPGTKRYYNLKEIAAKWRRMHGVKRKRRSISGSKKSTRRRRTKRGGILMGGVKKKKTATKKRKTRRAPRKSGINSLMLTPDIQRYPDAEKLCQTMGMMYCPTSQTCQELDAGLKCLSRAGISYIKQKNGNWMTIGGTDDTPYLSPLEVLDWWKNVKTPEDYEGGPVLPNTGMVTSKFRSNLGNVTLGPIKKSSSNADDAIAKALGIDSANARIFSEYLLKKNNLIGSK